MRTTVRKNEVYQSLKPKHKYPNGLPHSSACKQNVGALAPPTGSSPLLPPLPLQLHLLSGKNSGQKMATAGSRTSSSGLLDSDECANVGCGLQLQGGCSAPSLPSSPGKVKRNAGENAQWRRKELRKVRSVDLEKAESGAAPIAAQLHYLSVSSPAAVQATLSQHSRHVQHSNSLTEHPLLDKTSNSLSPGAQELPKTSCRSSSEQLSAEHAAPGTSVDVNSIQQR